MTTTSYSSEASMAAAGTASASKEKRIPGAKKLRLKELPPFTRQFAAMLSSGMADCPDTGSLE